MINIWHINMEMTWNYKVGSHDSPESSTWNNILQDILFENNYKRGKNCYYPPVNTVFSNLQLFPEFSSRDYSLIAILYLAEFSRGAFFITYLPLYTTEILGWSLAVAGLSASAHFLTENLFKILAGWHIDRYGRVIIRAGLAIALVSIVIIKIWTNHITLITFSAILGLGLSPLWAGVLSEFAPAHKKDRSTRISLILAAWLAGAGTGSAIINFFISQNYELAFWVILGSLITAFVIEQCVSGSEINTGKSDLYRSIGETVRELLDNKTVTRLLLPGIFLQTLSASILLPVIPVFATQKLGLDHRQYGFLLLAGGAVTVLCLVPMGKLTGKVKLKPILSGSFFAASAALAGLAVSGSSNNALQWVLALGVSYSVLLPAWNTLLSKAIPTEKPATGWGVFSTIEGFGISLGPAAGGIIAGRCNSGEVLIVTAGILMIMALFYLFYPIERLFDK